MVNLNLSESEAKASGANPCLDEKGPLPQREGQRVCSHPTLNERGGREGCCIRQMDYRVFTLGSDSEARGVVFGACVVKA